MSRHQRVRLFVVAGLALIQPVVLLAESFGASVTDAQAAAVQGVLAGIGVLILIAFGVSPPPEPGPK